MSEEYKDSYAGGYYEGDQQNYVVPNDESAYVPNYGKDVDSDEDQKTMALKDFVPLPGRMISPLDDKFEIEWDKTKYQAGITEWVKQGHIVYKIKVRKIYFRELMHLEILKYKGDTIISSRFDRFLSKGGLDFIFLQFLLRKLQETKRICTFRKDGIF